MLNSTSPCCEWKHIPHTYAFPGQSDMHVPCARFYIMSWFYWKHISVSTFIVSFSGKHTRVSTFIGSFSEKHIRVSHILPDFCLHCLFSCRSTVTLSVL